MKAEAGKVVEYKLPDGRKVKAEVVRATSANVADLKLAAKDAKTLRDGVAIPLDKSAVLVTGVYQGEGPGCWTWGERITPPPAE